MYCFCVGVLLIRGLLSFDMCGLLPCWLFVLLITWVLCYLLDYCLVLSVLLVCVFVLNAGLML